MVMTSISKHRWLWENLSSLMWRTVDHYQALSLQAIYVLPNKSRRAVIVELALVEDIGMTSIHLDFASTTIRNIPPLKGPAKSTCKCCQGRVGQIHGLFTFKGVLQCLAGQSGQSLWQSVPCHYPNLATSLAKDFIRTTPGWFRCSSNDTSCWYLDGITTLVPCKKQPFSTVNSSCLAW